MAKNIFRKAKRFPKMHLAVVGSLSFIALMLSILPSSEVEATRSQIELISPKALPEAQLPVAETTSSTLIEHNEQTSATTEVAEQPPAIEWQRFKVKSGDNLSKIFKRAGLGAKDVHKIAQADKKTKHFNALRPGQTLSLHIEDNQLITLRIEKSLLESVEFSLTDTGYQQETLVLEPEMRQRFVTGEISSSLYLAAKSAGLSENITMKLAEVFGWDIDFALDIRKGDQFRVLFEEKYLDGKRIGDGDILAAEFTNNGDTFAAVRYEDSNGDVNYFTPEGRSMRKAFLRSPVDFRRISSGFTRERYHPVLGVKRPHRGTDYAAKTGTPIKAAGDGKVIWRGTKGGYGRTVIIQHGGNITTLYGHMSKYNSKVKKGSRVKQGQTIGYVGMSGTATGPHLHYEFRVAGVHKNPQTVKLPAAQPIAKKERANFNKVANDMIASLQQKAIEQLIASESRAAE
ncbi:MULTISPECIES: OapA family protein [unclassified Marinobacterium]|uniref:OapA family protein n=1 Tax=unclassified Marinobacterium TaxID=2644139 RepID=UPI0020C23004|nr:MULTISPECIES: peptidoglycan DD-metalloendopeptidase family protein [unclassified Marinobacterium]